MFHVERRFDSDSPPAGLGSQSSGELKGTDRGVNPKPRQELTSSSASRNVACNGMGPANRTIDGCWRFLGLNRSASRPDRKNRLTFETQREIIGS